MNNNKQVKGRAIFSEPEQIRKKCLKLYMYLVCIANLRNVPNAYGDNVRIFHNLSV